ncbi:MAG: flagellar basal body rod protein FlgC [Deltaproteobacteria bacterium]|nr:MAG: flagellar basal body rod protein FlgC [Deltaproteobacteria bacterium]
MDLMQSMRISASGLAANRFKMNIIARNLANSETTRSIEGGPYKRKMVVFEETPIKPKSKGFQSILEDVSRFCTGVGVARVVTSQEDFRMMYEPEHPDADPETGYVAKPNVNPLTEITDMIVARRSYDASAQAIATSKSMVQKALEIGR